MTRRISLALTGLVVTLALAACGSDSPAPTADNASKAGPPRPERIVSMSPTATEMLYAIGAGPQVVAVDKHSNYPRSVPKGDLDAYQPNVEAIAAKRPDLVVITDADNDVVDGLRKLKISVLVNPAPTDLDGVYGQIRRLGRATGHTDGATKVVSRMRDGIDEVVDSSDVDGVSYFYELDSTLYSQTSKTFLGQLFGRLGMVNVADAASDTTDYPQLSPEFVIAADPDLVLLADTKCCQQSKATVAARPGWDTMTAVRGHGVVELDDDVASRWGPRLVDLLRQVADAAATVKAAA